MFGILRPPIRQWPAIARLLSKSGIWLLPWLLFSLFGVTVMLAAGAVGLGWKLAAEVFVECAAVWGLLGGVAALIAVWRSARQARRLGIRAMGRPRLWFELGRLSTAAFAFFLSVMVMESLLMLIRDGKPLPASLDRLGMWPVHAMFASYAGILITITLGYAVSWLSGRPPRGRPYRSIRPFYLFVGGGTLLGFAVAQWPPANVWPWGVACVAAAALGIPMMARGMLAFSAEYDRQPERPPHGETS